MTSAMTPTSTSEKTFDGAHAFGSDENTSAISTTTTGTTTTTVDGTQTNGRDDRRASPSSATTTVVEETFSMAPATVASAQDDRWTSTVTPTTAGTKESTADEPQDCTASCSTTPECILACGTNKNVNCAKNCGLGLQASSLNQCCYL